MGEGQGKSTWDRMNHEWGAPSLDGYAVCWQCACSENSKEAADVCWSGPVLVKLREHMKADFERMRQETPDWMQEIFDANPATTPAPGGDDG